MDIKVRIVENGAEMEIVRDIRHRVFIVEQNVPVSYTHLTLPTPPYV